MNKLQNGVKINILIKFKINKKIRFKHVVMKKFIQMIKKILIY